jgi:hypothetical protein
VIFRRRIKSYGSSRMRGEEDCDDNGGGDGCE